MFEIFIKNKDGSQAWNIPYESFSFREELNNDRNGRFSFTYQQADKIAKLNGGTVLDIFFSAFRIIEVYLNKTLLYRGYLRAMERTRKASEKGNITVGSKGIFQLLDRRLTKEFKFYDQVDLSDIAWDLIRYTQSKPNGDLGIIRGANPVTRPAQRTYSFDKIGESIDKLSNKERANGIDYELDLQNKFNVFYPFRGDDNGVTLVDGINIEEFTITRPSVDELTNYAVVQSTHSYGEGSLIASANGVNAGIFGLLEKFQSDDVKLMETVQEKADRIVDREDSPYVKIKLTVDNNKTVNWRNVNVGDFVTVKIPEEQIDGLFRVYAKGLNNYNIMSLELNEDMFT